ncbi:histidine biosynthesis trifunctional protein [Paracoccidioides lutzii Pb01]|uniref:Histidine biosynthesis trifunctional protein n=1 Tax=Paracoccidioides lutzii (strain ATCC MYA-826 / Pb01) TaxID=502779 RepID=C1H3R3_PARBA|nr:histidine biosynthesis trifunctional protein [Paracoccidioides lutzii Pb01]EEH34357.1 histidine biosynthesis trifunctional protein [Paracoccidioides lutzii Pb01]
MGIPFLVSVDPQTLSSTSPAAHLTIKQISYFGRVLLKSSSLSQVISFVKQFSSLLDIYADATTIDSAGDVLDILNSGASKVLVTPTQLTTLTGEQAVPSSRLIISVSSAIGAGGLQSWIAEDDERKNIGLHCVVSSVVDDVVEELVERGFVKEVYLSYDGAEAVTKAALNSSQKENVVTVIPSIALSLDNGDASPAKLLVAGATADQTTGLYTTVVTDERGVALGLVYSSEHSISEALKTGTGVYQSRKRGLWHKGQSSGDTQELVRVDFDCDSDCLLFVVKQKGRGFCHLGTASCFGQYRGLSRLQKTLQSRKENAPPGSYTARLFNDPKFVQAKIMEEAEELCNAKSKEEVAFEAADLLYFALTRCIAAGVSLEDVERNLDLKSLQVKRRQGDAKQGWAKKVGLESTKEEQKNKVEPTNANDVNRKIEMRRVVTATASQDTLEEALKRPSQKSNDAIVALVKPIIEDIRKNGDAAVLKYTHKFEKATSLTSPVIKAPFPANLMQVTPETANAINISFENIRNFHAAQKDDKPLHVETMPGVVCSRFSRVIERVGLYVPGGTAVLPSTAMMLGVPAMVAGCKKIVLASPPRSDGSISPEIVYIAHKVGAESIVLAGGAQAVAAMAYGTESISKVDKILGPGNQFVTAAKMLVSNDTSAGVSIDMPAGPSEVLVVADKNANPAFVASDLLSQAEHGVDSQVILVAVDLDDSHLKAIEEELHAQAMALPRVDIVRGAIDHSVTFVVKDIDEAIALSNRYAPEHLILQVKNAADVVPLVQNAGSVFIGEWTPESVGDYSAGVNHSLPTYGYAKQYSGVNLASFVKHITSSNLTAEGLRNVGGAVMELASVEGLDAHRRAVSIRLDHMDRSRK